MVARHPLPVEPMRAFFEQLTFPLPDLIGVHAVDTGQLIARLLLFGRFQRQTELDRAGVAIAFLGQFSPPWVG